MACRFVGLRPEDMNFAKPEVEPENDAAIDEEAASEEVEPEKKSTRKTKAK